MSDEEDGDEMEDGEEEDEEEGGEEDEHNGAPSQKRRKTDVYRPPTSAEAMAMRETAALFSSNLIKLQVTELLKEVSIDYKKCQDMLEPQLRVLQEALTSCAAQTVDSDRAAELVADMPAAGVFAFIPFFFFLYLCLYECATALSSSTSLTLVFCDVSSHRRVFLNPCCSLCCWAESHSRCVPQEHAV